MKTHIDIAAFFQHMPPYSGAAALRGKSIISSLALLLQGQQYRVQVFCTTPETTQIPGAEIITLNVPEVENSLGLRQRLVGELRMGWTAARRMFYGDAKPDLVIISSPGYLCALLLAAVARWRGVPYVLELRDIYPQVYAEAKLLKRDSVVYRLFRHFSQTMYRGAALVICATQGLAREVRHESSSARVEYVYNGFPAQLAARVASKHGRFTVCFHGVLGFFQDVDTLLNVTAALARHDVDVVVIGYGRKEAPLQSSKLPNLRFLGRQTFDATIAEIERCHVGLCLRLDDGISKDAFPVKVWEYLGLGIPSVVTPPCEAGFFLVANGCGAVFAAGDDEAIVDNVLRMKNDPECLHAMAEQCRTVGLSYTREQTGLTAALSIQRVIQQCQVTTMPAAS